MIHDSTQSMILYIANVDEIIDIMEVGLSRGLKGFTDTTSSIHTFLSTLNSNQQVLLFSRHLIPFFPL